MKYELTLKNEKVKIYGIIRIILAVLNLLGLIYLSITTPKDFKNLVWLLFGILASALYIIIVVIEKLSKKPGNEMWHRAVLLISAIAWFNTKSSWWISLLLVIFIGLDILAHRKLIIVFANSFVRLPVYMGQKIDWNRLSNVVLKDGMLTVDFKNNRLFQYPVVDSDWDINEEEFNRFCYQNISKAPPPTD